MAIIEPFFFRKSLQTELSKLCIPNHTNIKMQNTEIAMRFIDRLAILIIRYLTLMILLSNFVTRLQDMSQHFDVVNIEKMSQLSNL